MFNVRLAGGHLYGKQLFTWLSLVVSLMASFVLSFFPLDVLDEIWDLIESVSEGFLTYSCTFRSLLSEADIFCTHESFIMVQKVGSLNTGVGHLETLFVSPAVNGYLFSNQGRIRHRKDRNGLRVP